MTKPYDHDETVAEDNLTLPPPPSSSTMEELPTEEPMPVDPATALGAELAGEADGTEAAIRRAYLVVHEGHQGKVIEVPDNEQVMFGRSSAAHVVVDDPRVSRQHARIYRRGPMLIAEDLGSRNGTKVNGATLRSARRTIVSGDVLRVGSAEVIVAATLRAPDEPEDASIGVAVGDAKMREVFALAKQLAGQDTPVLIQGEPGVGKKIVARQIHRLGARADRPFVSMDCADAEGTRAKAALFGVENDARGERVIGILESANGGTVLLDGVAELSIDVQAQLLAALEARAITRVGGTAAIPIDVRVLAATHRDLPAEVAAKRFHEDLYYRLSAFTLRVPPLRERHAEIDLFAHLFARRFAMVGGRSVPSVDDDAGVQLLRYDWPGNVRELLDAIAQGVGRARAGHVTTEELPEAVQRAQRPSVRMRVP